MCRDLGAVVRVSAYGVPPLDETIDYQPATGPDHGVLPHQERS
jgi:hypothetical protein